MHKITAGTLWLTVDHDGTTSEGRQQYAYTITDISIGREYAYNDLHSGVGARVDEPDAMDTLLSFLGAAAEAYRHNLATEDKSDNSDLFPEWVMEAAYMNDDELDSARIDQEEKEK